MNRADLKEGLDLYKKRCEPGSFLRALLENDLLHAVECADVTSAYNLAEFVRITFNYLPGFMWGSPERVKQWLAGAVDENGEHR